MSQCNTQYQDQLCDSQDRYVRETIVEGPAPGGANTGRICKEAETAAASHQFLILSDRNIGPDRTAIPALLACGAVLYHPNGTNLRKQCAILIVTGEAREVHHICVLVGFGFDAICSYLVFEIAHMLRNEQIIDPEITEKVIYEN